MSNLSVVGLVHEVGETQQVTDKFKKRDLVVKLVGDNPEYVDYVKFEATQDRVTNFDGLSEGDSVEIFFNLQGRPWTNKDGVTSYFNTLNAWKITPLNQQEGLVAEESSDKDDDLPF